MIAQHQSKTSEHYTPQEVVEAARRWMGHIYLDPASCEEANKVVGAKRIITKEEDARSVPWEACTIFLNPPGGAERVDGFKSRSVACQFWEKLTRSRFNNAVFVGFTLEILRTTQCLGDRSILRFANHLCFPSSRLRFSGTSPTHANVIVGIGANQYEYFSESFGKIGECISL